MTTIQTYVVADGYAMQALSVTSSDIGSVALKADDNNAPYMLRSVSPSVWVNLTGADWLSNSFSSTLLYDAKRRLAKVNVGSPIAFTAYTGFVRPMSEVYALLVADGTNIPTFASPLTEHNSSSGYDNRAGVLNILSSWYDGEKYWYAWSQELVPVLGAANERFTVLHNVTESGNSATGYDYTGTGSSGAYANTPNLKLPALLDGALTFKYSGGSIMVALCTSPTPTDYWGNATYMVWNDHSNSDKVRAYSVAGGIVDTNVATKYLTSGTDLLRLKRTGTVMTIETSTDGTTWTQLHAFSGDSSTADLYPVFFSLDGSGVITHVTSAGMV